MFCFLDASADVSAAFFSDYSIKFIGPVNTGGADLFRILILSIFAA